MAEANTGADCDAAGSCSCGKQLADALERLGKLELELEQLKRSRKPDSKEAWSRSGPEPEPEPPRELPMAATQVLMQQVCLPLHCDQLGRCFGGKVLSWVDLCAGLSSSIAARGAVVTASVDAVHFVRPLRVNSIVILEGMVNCTFSSSMEVGVCVYEEDPCTGRRELCCHAFLTFVSLKSLRRPDNPHPQPLPQLVASTPEQSATLSQASERRKQRLAKAKAADGRGPQSLPPTCYREMGVPNTAVARTVSKADMARIKVSPGDTFSHMTQYVMPQNANPMGITFGGQVLAWVEQAAYLSAVRLSVSGHMMTAAMDAVTFKESTKVGDILYFTSAVTAVFHSSVEVMVSVFGERPFSGQPGAFFVLDAFVTLVSVHDDGTPQPMQLTLEPTNDVERQRMQEAHERKEARLSLRKAFSSSQNQAREQVGSHKHLDSLHATM
uniref:Acyl-CoA thioesteraes 11 n=1 Tax=Tetraselmis sp. GSL018 TaxID=582737 RepID=A0A061SI10_9CHLO|mmetsp:Transcript_2622/g.6196  ORF Transcript_2622/g.6196 Transcript_2622/m.6196 type:complete len:441 (-) Transcript_2622:133-1455(-)